MEEIDLKELFGLFWSKRLYICLIIAIFMVIGVIYTIGFVKPVYTSYTKLVLASSNSDKTNDSSITTNDININSKLVATYRELVQSKKILRTVISNLNIEIEEEVLRQNVEVSSVQNTEVIKIEVTNSSAEDAAKIANEIAKVFIEEVKKIYKIENVQVVDVAEVEEQPSNINHSRDIVIFTAIGVVIAVAYVFILNMFDTTIKTAEEIENMCKLPVLVSIPIYEDNVQKTKKGGKR